MDRTPPSSDGRVPRDEYIISKGAYNQAEQESLSRRNTEQDEGDEEMERDLNSTASIPAVRDKWYQRIFSRRRVAVEPVVSNQAPQSSDFDLAHDLFFDDGHISATAVARAYSHGEDQTTNHHGHSDSSHGTHGSTHHADGGHGGHDSEHHSGGDHGGHDSEHHSSSHASVPSYFNYSMENLPGSVNIDKVAEMKAGMLDQLKAQEMLSFIETMKLHEGDVASRFQDFQFAILPPFGGKNWRIVVVGKQEFSPVDELDLMKALNKQYKSLDYKFTLKRDSYREDTLTDSHERKLKLDPGYLIPVEAVADNELIEAVRIQTGFPEIVHQDWYKMEQVRDLPVPPSLALLLDGQSRYKSHVLDLESRMLAETGVARNALRVQWEQAKKDLKSYTNDLSDQINTGLESSFLRLHKFIQDVVISETNPRNEDIVWAQLTESFNLISREVEAINASFGGLPFLEGMQMRNILGEARDLIGFSGPADPEKRQKIKMALDMQFLQAARYLKGIQALMTRQEAEFRPYDMFISSEMQNIYFGIPDSGWKSAPVAEEEQELRDSTREASRTRNFTAQEIAARDAAWAQQLAEREIAGRAPVLSKKQLEDRVANFEKAIDEYSQRRDVMPEGQEKNNLIAHINKLILDWNKAKGDLQRAILEGAHEPGQPETELEGSHEPVQPETEFSELDSLNKSQLMARFNSVQHEVQDLEKSKHGVSLAELKGINKNIEVLEALRQQLLDRINLFPKSSEVGVLKVEDETEDFTKLDSFDKAKLVVTFNVVQKEIKELEKKKNGATYAEIHTVNKHLKELEALKQELLNRIKSSPESVLPELTVEESSPLNSADTGGGEPLPPKPLSKDLNEPIAEYKSDKSNMVKVNPENLKIKKDSFKKLLDSLSGLQSQYKDNPAFHELLLKVSFVNVCLAYLGKADDNDKSQVQFSTLLSSFLENNPASPSLQKQFYSLFNSGMLPIAIGSTLMKGPVIDLEKEVKEFLQNPSTLGVIQISVQDSREKTVDAEKGAQLAGLVQSLQGGAHLGGLVQSVVDHKVAVGEAASRRDERFQEENGLPPSPEFEWDYSPEYKSLTSVDQQIMKKIPPKYINLRNDIKSGFDSKIMLDHPEESPSNLSGYVLYIDPKDSRRALFTLSHNNVAQRMSLRQYRTRLLPAFDIQNMDDFESNFFSKSDRGGYRVVTINPGEAHLVGDKWIINRKSEIRIDW